MSTDVAVWFYCNDQSISDDEDSSEPNAHSEKTYVLDNCATTDQSEWEKEFQRSSGVSTGQQNLLNNEPSVNLSLCHPCEEYFCHSHGAIQTAPKDYSGGKIMYCFDKPLCGQCYDDDECQDIYEMPGDERENLTILRRDTPPWVWCDCRKSFACYDCFYESRRNNVPISANCAGCTFNSLCLCGADEEPCVVDRCDYCLGTFSCDTEDGGAEVSQREMTSFYLGAVDWNLNMGFYEALGIDPSSKLASLVWHLLSFSGQEANVVFGVLDVLDDRVVGALHSQRSSEEMNNILKGWIERKCQDGLLEGVGSLCREELGDLANQFVELDEIAVKQLSESQTDESE